MEPGVCTRDGSDGCSSLQREIVRPLLLLTFELVIKARWMRIVVTSESKTSVTTNGMETLVGERRRGGVDARITAH